MNYQIFKSRTFWTLAATFAYNVWQLVTPSVPVQYSALIDFAFTTLASYFHIQGVQNAAVASAQATAATAVSASPRVVSGQ